MLAPGLDRIGLVEANGRRDRRPDRSTSGSPKTSRAQPSLGNATIDQLQAPVGQPQARLGDRAHPRPRDPAAVEVGEDLRLGVSDDREQRTAVLAEVVEPLDEPRRRPAERVLGGVLDVGPPHPLIRVEDVDVAGSGRVRLGCDRARERRVLDERVDGEPLAGLEVHADVDREARVRRESLVGRTPAAYCAAPAEAVTYASVDGSPRAAALAVVILFAVAGCGGSKTYCLTARRPASRSEA